MWETKKTMSLDLKLYVFIDDKLHKITAVLLPEVCVIVL